MEGKPERILTVLIFIKLKILSLILSHMFLFKNKNFAFKANPYVFYIP